MLFAPLQPYDIYIEDERGEALYKTLLAIAVPGLRIHKVIPLPGKPALVEEAKRHKATQRPAVFLFDGDFAHARGEPAESVPGLHRLDCYCVENLLLSEAAVVDVFGTYGVLDTDKARQVFDYSRWVEDVERLLLPLFALYALLNERVAEHPTKGPGVAVLLTNAGGPALDTTKIQREVDRVTQALVNSGLDSRTIDHRRDQIIARNLRGKAMRLVCGKSFLLPLLEFRMRALEPKAKPPHRAALCMQLAKATSPSELVVLANAISGPAVAR